MKMTLRKKILLCSLLPVILLGTIVIILVNTVVKDSINEQIENALKGTAVATLAAYDQNSGSYLQAQNGDIWKGSYNISQSEHLVDTIREKSGMEVTFFYGEKRIMTSAFDKNGDRILGSPAGEKIVQKVLKDGEEYFSKKVSLDGTLYYGYFVPVYQKDDPSAPIGMVFAGREKSEAFRDVVTMMGTMGVTVIFLVIVSCVVVGFIATSISRALRNSIQTVQEVASGNLGVEVNQKILARKDDIGDLVKSIASLQGSLRKMIGDIGESTTMLVDASDSLENTSHETYKNLEHVKLAVDSITEGANVQAGDAKKASDDIQHMGSLIIETGREAGELNGSADIMKQSSDEAALTIEELKRISIEVKRAIENIAQQTEKTNQSAQKIKEASDFISDIAEETNLLSLNASIEAARAGEAGKGFAVVADQIQKLAEQSDNASGSIGETVNELIENSELVVNTMVKVKEIIEKQNRHIDNTEQTVNEVMNEIETSVESIRSIENKTRELERSRTEVVNIIATLSDIAQQNVTSTQGTNEELKEVTDNFKNLDESARNLRSTADILAANISNFKL